MSAPTVAVVGSLATGRSYDPPLRDVAVAARAAEEIGRELAQRGCGLVVFSSDEGFIEAAVVRGYVRSGLARPGSVEVRGPYRAGPTEFPEARAHPELFDTRPEPTPDWEVSFYRVLLHVDATLLIGGGRSTFIAGLIALSRRAAVAPVGTFGGAAEKAWHRMHGEPDAASEEDLSAMVSTWRPGSAEAIVGSLLRQHERRLSEQEQVRRQAAAETRRRAWSLLSALVLLTAGLAALPAATAWRPGTWAAVTLLVFGPLCAAMSGALIRNVFDEVGEWLRAAVFGAAAGGLSAVLFLAAQLTTNPNLLQGDSAARLGYFVVPVGFAAGLAFDAVLTKLRGTDVVRTQPVDATTTDGRAAP
ncbi:hypothetical protein [Micromonospora sp. NPDC049282]|uniref:hypothetical protein n=1 Tax=Micromonospora sp. NPDC049282 TaxID=3364269 RepID=UPI00372026B5